MYMYVHLDYQGHIAKVFAVAICDHLGYQDHCTVHLINEGVSVRRNIVKMEFVTTGPVTSLTCIINQNVIGNCKSNQAIKM